MRALPDDSPVAIDGVLTTALGALESGRSAFVQDDTAGIALYLSATVVDALPAGTSVRMSGVTDTRYGQRTVRIDATDLLVIGAPGVPPASDTPTGAANEALEGTRIALDGTIVGGTDDLSDGIAVSIDDGSGPARIVVAPDALGGATLVAGSTVHAVGPLGQRDSSGTGTTGYRVYVTLAGDLSVAAPPTPTPSPSPTATPLPSATPTPGPSHTPSPAPTTSPSPTAAPSASPNPTGTPTPSATPTGLTIADARSRAVGTVVTISGIVTAEAGRLGTPPLIAIGDASGGIAIRLPDGAAPVARGTRLIARGPLADPYGQLELRPAADGITVAGSGPVPAAVALGSSLGESTEGRLIVLTGRLTAKPAKATSGDISMTIAATTGLDVRVYADASSGVSASAFVVGATYRLTGIAGQRATHKGALDGYRLWLRDPADIVLVATPSPSPTSTPRPTATPKPPAAGATATPKPSTEVVSVSTIARALRITDRDVAIEAVVTAGASLLDASGRRIVVQDASGAVEVLLPKDAAAPGIGTRVRVDGRIGAAYGAPRLRAESMERLGSGATPAPLVVTGSLTDTQVWRLVSVHGRIEDVKKLGDRWRAEVLVGSQRILVTGQPGAGIAVAGVIEGRNVRLIGIVRRAFPSSSDRRPTLLPRSPADIDVAGAAGTGSASAAGAGAAGTGGSGATGSGTRGAAGTAGAGSSPATGLAAAPDVDLVDLAAADGTTVRVGGLITELLGDGFRLDDGTAIGRVVLAGAAADRLDLIEPGDAINAVGRVSRLSDGALGVLVTDPAGVTLGSDPTADSAATDPAASGQPGTPASPGASDGVDALAAGFGTDAGSLPGAGAGLASLLGIVLLSVAVTVLRRRHTRQLLAGRVAARIAAFAGVANPDAARGPAELADAAPPATDPLAGPGGPERGVSVGHAR